MHHPDVTSRLRAALDTLTDKDRPIAIDMLARAKRYGGQLTERQEVFALTMLQRAAEKAQGPKAPLGTVDLTRIHAMFDFAGQNLKRPKVQFRTEAGDQFTVSPAGPASRNPGSLYVKNGSTYLGKIDRQGNFDSARDVSPDDGFALLSSLRSFAADPVSQARLYGQLVGSCCFCARELTDARSIHVGYGPICADRYGLPWGELAAEAA